jgi:hypothetical protein
MSTPPASSPGDAREDHAQEVAAAVAVVYGQLELVMVATVAALARKVAAGIMTGQLAQRKLAASVRIAVASSTPRVQAILGREPAGSAELPQLLDGAVERAVADAHASLADAISAAEEPAPLPGVHRQVVDRAIAGTRGGMPGTSLSLSRIQAAQTALDELGARGITGYVDRAGRRWDLVSYVEMATRTAVSNAWDEHQAAALIRAGIDLVLVGTDSTEGSCPKCLPWLGRTLSLAGATPGFRTLAEAKAAGFRHPNCRCSWAPVGVNLAPDVTNPVSLDRAAAAYQASQRQRALERRVREAHRRMAAAVTPAARAKARRDLAAARAASAQHRQRSGLVMTKVSAIRRQHPFRAR